MNAFVARQPIFDRNQNVVAYELLFRVSSQNSYNCLNGDTASLEVINNSFHLIGIDSLTGGKRAFINFTKNLLKSDIATILPKDLIVVEILEDIEIDDEIINACKRLKQLGYTIALDDFVYNPEFNELIKLADIIKIDFINTKGKERAEIVERFKFLGIKFLAEKVETQEEFKEALDIGYSYFQGYFFSKPLILSTRDIPTFKWSYINMLNNINKSELDIDKIEDIIKKDVGLSYKLLRFINSSAFGFRVQIRSIKHALNLIGKQEIIKWLSLTTIREIGNDKPDELLKISIIRAKFGELISYEIGFEKRASDVFLMGMFSMIDALTNRPLNEVLNQLPITDDAKIALLGGQNYFGDIYNLIVACETGEWDNLNVYLNKLNLSEKQALDMYVEALNWGNELFKL